MLRWSPQPEPKAAAAPASSEAPPQPRPQSGGPASLARAGSAGCLGEVSRELIGMDNDQWKRAAAPGAGGWQGGAGRDRAQSAAEPLGLARARWGYWATQARALGWRQCSFGEVKGGQPGQQPIPGSLPPAHRLQGRLLAHALGWSKRGGEGAGVWLPQFPRFPRHRDPARVCRSSDLGVAPCPCTPSLFWVISA